MYGIFITLIILLVCPALAQIPEKLKSLHLVRSCSILDISGNVLKTLPGTLCLFLDDGSFISSNVDSSLRYFNPDSTVKWAIPGMFHHQLNISADKKTILAMASKVKERIRYDTFLIISLEGKILHEQSSDVILKHSKLPAINWPTTKWVKDHTLAELEWSHFNSFYEIPDVLNGNNEFPFQKGNFIINGLVHGIFILSSDLKNVLLHFSPNKVTSPNFHDVQVNNHGNVLYFNNSPDESSLSDSFSSIVEYDYSNKKKVFEFMSNPRSMFYSQSCGGVQEIDEDHLLFSDHFNATYLYSKSKKEMIATIRGTHLQGSVHLPSQQIKAFDLKQFLKNHKSL